MPSLHPLLSPSSTRQNRPPSISTTLHSSPLPPRPLAEQQYVPPPVAVRTSSLLLPTPQRHSKRTCTSQHDLPKPRPNLPTEAGASQHSTKRQKRLAGQITHATSTPTTPPVRARCRPNHPGRKADAHQRSVSGFRHEVSTIFRAAGFFAGRRPAVWACCCRLDYDVGGEVPPSSTRTHATTSMYISMSSAHVLFAAAGKSSRLSRAG